MCLTAYACLCGNSHSKINQKVGRPAGEGGRKVSDNRGQTGEGGLKISILAGCPL